jgi:hypothetical protein
MSNLVKQENNSIQQWQPTKTNSLTIYKELNLVRVGGSNISISTAQELCIREDNYQISSLIVKSGDVPDKTNCYKLIELFVIEIFEWFGKEIRIELIQSLAQTIYKNYYWLRLSELKLFVERVKGGHWQQMHNMSPAVLMERLADFAESSMTLREQIGEMENSIEKDANERESVRQANAHHTAHLKQLFDKQLQKEIENKPQNINS